MKIFTDVFDGNSVRVIHRDGVRMMAAIDVAISLGYPDPRRAASDFFIANKEKLGPYEKIVLAKTPDGNRRTRFFALEGIVLFCMKSNMSKADTFQKWAMRVLADQLSGMADTIRVKSIRARNAFTGTLSEHGVNKPWQFGKITKDMKPPLGIDRDKSKSDYDLVELSKTMASEALATVKIIQEKAIGFIECHGHSVKSAHAIGELTKLEIENGRVVEHA